jgi:hypothetical protein
LFRWLVASATAARIIKKANFQTSTNRISSNNNNEGKKNDVRLYRLRPLNGLCHLCV